MKEDVDYSDDVKALRKALSRSNKFSEGTVVRFKSDNTKMSGYSSVEYYSYAALFVADRWWLTGYNVGRLGASVFSTEEFVDKVLSRDTTFDIEVATEFEGI